MCFNIALGSNTFTKEQVIEAAKIANAHNFIVEMENGYETSIGDRGGKLSGGQRQRLSIARAVLKNPPILILDEATSALDTESEKLVQDALLPISLEEEDSCLCPVITDAYGFRMTVVLPAWTNRFAENSFRKLVEKTIRLEAPAHVFVNIVWANVTQLNTFETTFKTWLEENAKGLPNVIPGRVCTYF